MLDLLSFVLLSLAITLYLVSLLIKALLSLKDDLNLYDLDLNQKQLINSTPLLLLNEQSTNTALTYVLKSNNEYCIKHNVELPNAQEAVIINSINQKDCLLFEEDSDTPKVNKYSLKIKGYFGKREFYEIIVPKGTISIS